ncbi:MAG: hypothetical protein AB1697_06720 [Pseudomonadota bacterium]
MTNIIQEIETREADLWAAADKLRVKSGLTFSGEFMFSKASPNDHGRNPAGTTNSWH